MLKVIIITNIKRKEVNINGAYTKFKVTLLYCRCTYMYLLFTNESQESKSTTMQKKCPQNF